MYQLDFTVFGFDSSTTVGPVHFRANPGHVLTNAVLAGRLIPCERRG